ncbi:hypothetical protein [Lichenibacterium dinghuense]|uniref:hypothetical protein n=1 Tax=Lichenibacterium dinghuense TaxID=2895977 RepID=UPI001F309F85|nr:hypothetical protein [Lichenibacterium sp. 6Y81]
MPPAKPNRADHLRLVPPAAATRSVGDWLWHGLGAGVATASAGFATYALVFSTGEVVPSGNFNLFSRSPASQQAAAAQHAAPVGDDALAGRGETADRGGVDFAPTGSLAGPAAAVQGRPGGGMAGRRRGPDGPTLPNFTLRDVFDGKALVESRSSLSVVKPGSMLDGAGEVLSIEKYGERWIVLTRNGVIAGQSR